MEAVAKHILTRIRNAEARPDPFPHLVVPDIFPPDFYLQLMAAMPKPEQFAPVDYPGLGFGKADRRQRKAPGLAYPNLHELPLFQEIQSFLRGEEFCRALLEKFSVPGGIPADKYRYFVNGAREFTSVLDLQIDRRRYEVLPHRDIPDKIVTFQFYLLSDDALSAFGTLFCRPRNGCNARRGRVANRAGAIAGRIARRLGGRPASFWHWLERARLGTEIGFGLSRSRSWLPWRLFEVVASAQALPNHFMAFAPNERSYHAVRMDIPASSIGRTVIRGFIRRGKDARNFISFAAKNG